MLRAPGPGSAPRPCCALRHLRRGLRRGSRAAGARRAGGVVLVLDVADDFFEDVLEGHDAEHGAARLADDGHVAAAAAELAEGGGDVETGAHLEYLYERGKLIVANIDEIEQDPARVPLYRQS